MLTVTAFAVAESASVIWPKLMITMQKDPDQWLPSSQFCPTNLYRHLSQLFTTITVKSWEHHRACTHPLTLTHTPQKTDLFWAPCTSLRSPNSHHQPWTHLWKKERSTFTHGIKRECKWPVYINTLESLLQKVLNKPTPPAQRSTPPQKSNAIESFILWVQILLFHGYNSLTFLTMITSGVDDWVKPPAYSHPWWTPYKSQTSTLSCAFGACIK